MQYNQSKNAVKENAQALTFVKRKFNAQFKRRFKQIQSY